MYESHYLPPAESRTNDIFQMCDPKLNIYAELMDVTPRSGQGHFKVLKGNASRVCKPPRPQAIEHIM